MCLVKVVGEENVAEPSTLSEARRRRTWRNVSFYYEKGGSSCAHISEMIEIVRLVICWRINVSAVVGRIYRRKITHLGSLVLAAMVRSWT